LPVDTRRYDYGINVLVSNHQPLGPQERQPGKEIKIYEALKGDEPKLALRVDFVGVRYHKKFCVVV
jgi:hypothetical protein